MSLYLEVKDLIEFIVSTMYGIVHIMSAYNVTLVTGIVVKFVAFMFCFTGIISFCQYLYRQKYPPSLEVLIS